MKTVLLIACFAFGIFINCDTGFAYEEHYPGGSLKKRGNISEDGEKEGKWQYWYSNGSLLSEGHYEDGNPQGKWTYYDKAGKLLTVKEYSDGADVDEESEESEEVECFESREGYTAVTQEEIKSSFYMAKTVNVKCSKRTGGILWWSDPFFDTVPMGNMPIEADYSNEEAVVRPRVRATVEEGEIVVEDSKLIYFMPCTMCHNGVDVPTPRDTRPRPPSEEFPHFDVVEDPMNLQHGRGAIWCLDCHSRTNRNVLIDHRGNEISFNQPMKLCGKCHGHIYRDWRDGIHGKRIGMWTPGGKKRWWVCTECHNPHDVQQGARNKGFAQLQPEPAP